MPKQVSVFVDKKTGEVEQLRKDEKPDDPPQGKKLLQIFDDDILECPCGSFLPLKAVWVDLERGFDGAWAKALGVRMDLLWIVEPESAEQSMDICDVLLRSGELDLLIIDSIAMMTPKKEIEKSFEDELVAVLARKVNRMLRKITSAQNAQGGLHNAAAPTVLLINQTRMSIGPFSYEVLPGGKGMLFANATELKLKQGEWREHTKKGINHHPAMQTVFQVRKNKVGPPKKQGNYWMWVEEWKDGKIVRKPGEVEEAETIVAFAKQFGVLNEPEEHYEALIEKCRAEPPFLYELRCKTMEAMLT